MSELRGWNPSPWDFFKLLSSAILGKAFNDYMLITYHYLVIFWLWRGPLHSGTMRPA